MYTTCRYRCTKIGGLPDLENVVNSSATVNVAQPVGSMDGTVTVPTYDWTAFLAEHIGKCVGIKSFHHLRFSADHKGYVFVREKSDSPEVAVKLLKDDWSPDPTDLPERIMPSGLSPTRQWYLFNKISFVPMSVWTSPALSPVSQKTLPLLQQPLLFLPAPQVHPRPPRQLWPLPLQLENSVHRKLSAHDSVESVGKDTMQGSVPRKHSL